MGDSRRWLVPSLVLALLGAALPSAAGAQVTVVHEDTGEPCPPVSLSGHVVTGGCRFAITSERESQIVSGTAGGPVVISTCEERFETAIGANGEGYIYEADLQDHAGGPPCTREACDEAAPSHVQLPWPIHLRESPDVMEVTLCLRNETSEEGSGTTCVWAIPWTQASNPHELSFNAEVGLPCTNLPPGAVTWVGHWHSEPGTGGEEVELHHEEPPVQVLDEGASTPCSTVTLGTGHAVTGGCRVRILSEEETEIIYASPTGPLLISTCEDDLEAAFDSAGEGYVYSIGMAGHAMSQLCTRTPCDEDDAHPHPDIPWRAHIRGAQGSERLDLTLCLRQVAVEEGIGGTTCQLSLPVTQTANPHQLHIDAEGGVPCSNLEPVGLVTFYGHWHSQAASGAHTELEVLH